MITKVIICSLLVEFVTAQRCDQGDTVCTKLEKDDPVFQGQRCEVASDCKGKKKKSNSEPVIQGGAGGHGLGLVDFDLGHSGARLCLGI